MIIELINELKPQKIVAKEGVSWKIRQNFPTNLDNDFQLSLAVNFPKIVEI